MACREEVSELFEGVTTVGTSVVLELALHKHLLERSAIGCAKAYQLVRKQLREVRRREPRQACPLATEGGLGALHGSLCFGERYGGAGRRPPAVNILPSSSQRLSSGRTCVANQARPPSARALVTSSRAGFGKAELASVSYNR